jgi:hypothetical protein
MFRNLVLARAISVEPIARAFYLAPIDAAPFSRNGDRWRSAARRAAESTWVTAAHETASEADDLGSP